MLALSSPKRENLVLLSRSSYTRSAARHLVGLRKEAARTRFQGLSYYLRYEILFGGCGQLHRQVPEETSWVRFDGHTLCATDPAR